MSPETSVIQARLDTEQRIQETHLARASNRRLYGLTAHLSEGPHESFSRTFSPCLDVVQGWPGPPCPEFIPRSPARWCDPCKLRTSTEKKEA